MIDYGALIVHVFYDFVRQEYRLEDLWKMGRDLEIREELPSPHAKPQGARSTSPKQSL